jgi:hypothetical protein
MAIHTEESARSVALDCIDVPDNVRELDAAHVQALAGSIALQGLLVPLVVRRAGERFELVAGFHRAAAARSLGLTEVPIVVRDAESEDADRAVENITSCRHRHDVINADVVVMPTSVAGFSRSAANAAGRVGMTSQWGMTLVRCVDGTCPFGAGWCFHSKNERALSMPAVRLRFVGRESRGCPTVAAVSVGAEDRSPGQP